METGSHRGLPILSGEPPRIESSSACVDCGKDFNPLWRRPHSCGHCGYARCSSCMSDGQALMPRPGGGGYDVEPVCLFCLSMLQVTAASLAILRALPVKRLKEYLAAYDIKCVGPKEKEDFVQAVVKARNSATGCLPPENESYFRRKSVPRKGVVPSPRQTPAPAQSRPATRPSPPNNSNANSHQHRPPPPNNYNPHQYRPPPPNGRPAPAQPRPAAASPRPAAPAVKKTPPPPVPTILSLVPLPTSYLQTLSIGTLKAILFENHVRVDFKQVLEKDELVARVSELIRDERNRLERQRLQEEREARGSPSPSPGDEASTDEVVANGAAATASKVKVPTGPVADLDRGLCVVCQDEEAVLAVVDCGHLAMCATCSDLIMATSRECPLCRTRIVTEQRLIRIYRT